MTKTCQHFNEKPDEGCGGCRYQHLSPDDYQKFKKQRVEKALIKHGMEGFPVHDVVTVPPKTRWRARLHGVKTQDGVQLGFLQAKSHHIVDMKECQILSPKIFALIEPLRQIMGTVIALRTRFEVQITVLGEQIDVLLLVPQSFDTKRRQILANFANEHHITRIAEQVKKREPEPIVSRETMIKIIENYPVSFPIGGFLQASLEGEVALQKQVVNAILPAKPKKIADLFCGMGTFSLPLADEKFVKNITAYDSFAPAITAFDQGVRQNNLGRVTPHQRDLYDLPLTRKELDGFDCVIVDPPRKGAYDQMLHLAKSSVPLVVYVSCHPDTFARDVQLLIKGGYKPESITPVDQFIWSHHIETVGVFTKNKKRRR